MVTEQAIAKALTKLQVRDVTVHYPGEGPREISTRTLAEQLAVLLNEEPPSEKRLVVMDYLTEYDVLNNKISEAVQGEDP